MIVGVAVRFKNGEVRSLPKPARHCHLFAEYNQNERDSGRHCPWEGWPAREVRRGEQGFVDEQGKYFTREQALAHVRVIGQPLMPNARAKTWLFSEDVW